MFSLLLIGNWFFIDVHTKFFIDFSYQHLHLHIVCWYCLAKDDKAQKNVPNLSSDFPFCYGNVRMNFPIPLCSWSFHQYKFPLLHNVPPMTFDEHYLRSPQTSFLPLPLSLDVFMVALTNWIATCKKELIKGLTCHHHHYHRLKRCLEYKYKLFCVFNP